MQKNVAGQKIGCQMVSATDGSAFTSAVTISVTGDAGTQATGSVSSGACTHEGNGYHTYAPATAETNYDMIAFTFTGTGAIPATIQIYTRVDTNVIEVSGDTAAATNLELDYDGTGYAKSNSTIGTCTVNTDQRGTDSAATASSLTTVEGKVDAVDDYVDTEIAAIKSVVDDILVDTAEIGTAGVGLSNLGGMSTSMKAEINTECDSSMVSYGLDHLLSASVSDGDVADNSVFAMMVSKESTAGWDDYEHTTDSLQAIRDEGSSNWLTAAGFSTHNAAAVWSSGSRTLSAATNITSDGAAINTTSGVIDTVTTNTDMRGTDSAALASSLATLTTTVGTAGAGLTDLGGMSTGMKAEINTEVDSGIVTYGLDHLVSVSVVGADIVDNSIVAKLVSKESTADWDDFVNTTDSLQAISDDSGGGGGGLDSEGIRDAIGLASANLDTQLSTIDSEVGVIDGIVDSILVDTSSTLDAAISVIDTNVDQIEAAVITNATGADIAADIIAIKAETANIVADTGELQADDIPTSLSTISTKIDAVDNYVDTEISAIKTVADSILLDTAEIGAAGAGLTGAGASAASIANEVWDRTSASHTTANTFGKYLDAEISGVASGSEASPTLLQSTTIATLASQTSFTLSAGSTDNDAFNGCTCIITDGSDTTQKSIGEILDYTGATKTITLSKDPGIFSYEAGDSIKIVSEGTGARQDELLTDVSAITVITSTPAGDVTYASGIAFSIAQSNGNTGWPPTIRKGSGYTVANGSAFKLTPQDANGDAIESLGTTNFSDTPAPIFHFDKMKNQDNIQDFVGSVSWVVAAGEIDGHWLLTISTTETAKASTYTSYMGHLILWPGGSDQTTILSQRFSIAPNIAAS